MLRSLAILTAAVLIMLISSNPILAADPVAGDDSYSVDEDNALGVAAPGVLGNDTDTEFEPLEAYVFADPVSGVLALNPDGSFTYTPNPNFNGSDTFWYRAWDGTGYSAPAQVTITVTAVNDVPSFTKGLNQTVPEDSVLPTVNGWATGISRGAADEAGQAVDFIVSNNNNPLFSSQPAISPTGTLTFTPAADANGIATVTVRIHDDGGTANGGVDTSAAQTFTVTVTTVNDAPSFNAVSNPPTVLEDAGAQTIASWATGMSAGPSNESGQTLGFVVTANTNGALFSVAPAINGTTGNLTYTPAANANGSANITIELRDNGGTANGGDNSSNPQTFTITVTAVNDVPSFTKGSDQTVPEDSGLWTVNGWATGISAGPNETAQAVDFIVSNNNNPLFSSQPAISPTGTLTFTPAADANGIATVTVRIHDDGGTANGGVDTSAAQTFTITVTAVNDAPPFTKGGDQTIDEDAGSQTLVGWATGMSPGPADESGQSLIGFTVTNDNNALFSVQPAIALDGTLTYTPRPNAFGSATVTVTLQDDGGTANGGSDTSAPQTFAITVNPFNDAPVANFSASILTGVAPLAIAFSNMTTDVDDLVPDLTWSWAFGDGGTSMQQNPSYTYTQSGVYTVSLTATDPSAASDTETKVGIITVNLTIRVINTGRGTGTVDVSTTSGMSAGAGKLVPASPGTLDLVVAHNDTVTISNPQATGGSAFISATSGVPVTLSNVSGDVIPVSANFQLRRVVTITNPGSGTGTVDISVTPSALETGTQTVPANGTLTLDVADGDSVSLTNRQPAANSIFISTGSSLASPDDFAISGSDVSRIAVFELKRTITLSNPGTGAGTLTVTSSTPSGADSGTTLSIAASGTATFNVAENDTVNVGAAGDATSIFAGFNGDQTGITPTVFAVNGNQTGTAEFKKIYTLTINWHGVGNGTVSASIGTIGPLSPFTAGSSSGTEGNSFSRTCLEDDVIALMASDTYPAAGSVFKGWGGAIGGTAYSTDVIMDSNKPVTAEFNATYSLTLSKDGSGAGRATVSAFPGGEANNTFVYELGATVSLAAADIMPTAAVTGSEFQNWTIDYPIGYTPLGFSTTNKTNSVAIDRDLSLTGNFSGKYMITSLARTGGTITPVGSIIKLHGESQSYSMAASTGYVQSDTVIDGFSQGALPSYTFDSLSNNHEIIAVFQSGSSVFVGQAAGDEQIYTASAPPMVLLVMGRDHKLYYEAYNDSSDLDGNGTIDVGYKPSIDYYGYFDSYKVYRYGTIPGTTSTTGFYPVRTTANKKVNPAASDEWSGDFLNYLTMSRMDVLRKVLYGGYRSTDTASLTVLERVYIPQDAHSWGKEYHSVARDGYGISDYTPLNIPAEGTRHLFASTNLGNTSTGAPYLNQPLLRVLPDSGYRVWEWVSIDKPVAGICCFSGDSNSNGECDEDFDDNLIPDNLTCATSAVPGNLHPPHPTDHKTFELMARKYGDPDVTPTGPARSNEIGRGPVASGVIDVTLNPAFGTNNFLTIFKGDLWIKSGEAGNYRFAVTGGDAVEVLVDGVYRANAGHYGAHASDNRPSSHSSASIYMPAGKHTIEFRHEFQQNTTTDSSSYKLWWAPQWASSTYSIIPPVTFSDPYHPSATTITSDHGGLHNLWRYTWNLLINRPASVMTDYQVRVLVADSSMPESHCKQYPNGNYKPIGLLQRFGEPGKLLFGLMTGSYEKHLSGGVLRKTIGPINDEINAANGTFTSANGIIKTIDKLRITGFTYAYRASADTNYFYDDDGTGCGWITEPLTQGKCKMWGNPIAEMMYEGLRYFAGQGDGRPASPTSAFDTNSGVDVALGLPHATWDNPFVVNGACAKPFMLVISDINPSYDSDQLPGVLTTFGAGLTPALTSFDTTPVPLDVEDLGNEISGGPNGEGITGSHYIGQVASTDDGSCSPKNLTTENGFGRIRGLCPEEPTKRGSYYSSSVAYFGRTHDISASAGEQNLLTYVVGLASPLPRFEIRASNNRLITLVPFAKTVGDTEIFSQIGNYKPTNTIVDFYIESLSPTTATFRVNFEDVEQGADHDMDAIAVYSYELLDDNDDPVSNPADGTKLRVTVVSEYAGGTYIQHMGYIVSGTTADGTYLEVRDADTPENQDVDYFLDTPPGSSSPATTSQWDDNKALPLVAGRLFTVGNIPAATLLNDPLRYAAKWGGFVDQDDNKKPNLQSEWDADGDGSPDTYYYVVNPLKLEQQLNWTFSDIVSRGVSHVAPVVSVDEANRTQSGDKLYMAFFKPMSDNYWQGNLKKYGLDYVPRDDCGRPASEWTVVDANDAIAGLCDGTFKSSSRSYWSAGADGASVDKGGAGGRLKAKMPGSNPKTPASPYYSWRNIYTYQGALDGSMAPFTKDFVNNTDLEVTDDLTRFRIINFMYGYTFDAVSSTNSDPLAKREWILGDIIHSEPRVIDYFDEEGNVTHRFIAVGANDGMLHVFVDGIDNTTTTVNIGGTTYSVGDEIFAFIPRDLLRRLQEFSRADTHISMVDGSPALYRSNTRKTVSGTEHYEKTLVFGERAGGRSYWALDVTGPDPSTWKVKWQIQGGTGGTTGFEELGYTWSKPFFAKLKTGSSTTKEVLIFAGGYDPIEDGFPEGFDDQNKNGIRDGDDVTGELHGVSIGGTIGYDKWNPGMDSMGRGIFVVDLADGTILFKATFGDLDVTTGINQKYAMMKYCFPADLSVIPLSDSNIIMYAADVYGQIWRIRYDYNAFNKWSVKRIFTANPGSNLASGDATTFTSNTQALVSTDAGRKMFYSPDVSLFGNDWTGRPVLYVGTGDRQHARYAMISNRMYFVSDTGTVADETDLLNLTCNELDVDATVAADTKTALRNILLNGTNSVRGFYRVLDKQGNCADDDISHAGEGVMSQPTLFFKNVFFTSYQPVFDDPCNPAGNAFIYALDYSLGASGFNYDFTNDTTEAHVRTLKDTYRFISGSSIPSGVRVIMRGGHAAGLISAGGAVAGVGEDGSTNIPGPPGGITPLVWETE